MCFVKGAITVFMTLLFGMILSLVLVTIENVRFLTGESYARLSAKGALYAVFGEYNRELYEDYGLFGYGGYSQKNRFRWKNKVWGSNILMRRSNI